MSTDAMVLVGNSKGGTLTTLHISDEQLVRVSEVGVGAGCSTFAVDHARGLLYVATAEPSPAIVTLRIDREQGRHQEVSRRPVEDALVYLDVSPRGHMLLAASYHGGWGASYRVLDGVVGEESARLESRNMHAALFDPTGHNAYFVSLGDDRIAQFATTVDGGLAELSEPFVHATPGTGPRHLVFSPDSNHAYLLTEFTGEAIHFDRGESGRLTRREEVRAFDVTRGLHTSSFGVDPIAGHLVWGADLALAAGGRWLLCTERTESTVGAIAVGADGTLRGPVVITDTETQPRGLTVSPEGEHVVVVGERSGHASLYRIYDDGHLVLQSQLETGAGPNWVRFL
ncbi:beta-propeller fold lactonase family protein [Tessaracoccus sp. MC1756]|uniref:lactonase family protein n=1 Tax=Tessaracoccus sp. MC1756 TaxID=2760311 RepID=UPI0016002B1F|nr:beta-propeller fold lactonase family protein [Tessaracoccus sp. MC1756]MBB1510442.1 beta-propeller fold lactonase family protein [Tessaracoccus sp. MC1756]